MDKEFNQETFIALFKEETVKVLQAISKLHQKVLAIEARIAKCESEINRLDKLSKSTILLH